MWIKRGKENPYCIEDFGANYIGSYIQGRRNGFSYVSACCLCKPIPIENPLFFLFSILRIFIFIFALAFKDGFIKYTCNNRAGILFHLTSIKSFICCMDVVRIEI